MYDQYSDDSSSTEGAEGRRSGGSSTTKRGAEKGDGTHRSSGGAAGKGRQKEQSGGGDERPTGRAAATVEAEKQPAQKKEERGVSQESGNKRETKQNEPPIGEMVGKNDRPLMEDKSETPVQIQKTVVRKIEANSGSQAEGVKAEQKAKPTRSPLSGRPPASSSSPSKSSPKAAAAEKKTMPTAAAQPRKLFAAEATDHFSFSCHLFPRLSESHLQFHDLYWDHQEVPPPPPPMGDNDTHPPPFTATGTVILRKRHVAVNKLIRGFVVRVDEGGGGPIGIGSNSPQFRASLSLLDRRPLGGKHHQIVSNILAIQVPVADNGMAARVFKKTPASASLLVRSNYRQRVVALQIVLLQQQQQESPHPHPQQKQHQQSSPGGMAGGLVVVSQVEMELLDERGQMALPNGRQRHTFERGIHFEFELTNVPPRLQLQTDSLPDVLLCDERWIGMLAIYRQLMCERMAEEGDVFADRTTLLVDPIMATLPRLLDTDKDAVDLLLSLMQKYDVMNREVAAHERTRRFRFVYMQFMVPLVSMLDPGKWRKELAAFIGGQRSEEPNPVAALAREPCRQLDMGEYAINLAGNHAIH